MTSEERHEARYQRRKAKREARILARSKELGDFDEVFSFRHLYLSGKKCCKNVMWKNSTQRFMGTLLLEVSEIRKQLMNETFTGKALSTLSSWSVENSGTSVPYTSRSAWFRNVCATTIWFRCTPRHLSMTTVPA